jgi:pimeloyl-ACP methyl ester carboxylesterase
MNKIISKDGTPIVYDKTGAGPAIILVDGAFCSRKFGPMPKLAPFLAEHFTVFAYDRRARGDSGDTQPYSVQREIEDIAALIDLAGGSASLFGISSGAALCIKAVAGGLNIKKAALFEPPYRTDAMKHRAPADAFEQLMRITAEGRRSDAVRFYFRKVMGMPAILPFIMQFTSNWATMKANANSLPYDAAVLGNFIMPKDQIAAIHIPAMAIDSEKSPALLRKPVEEVAALLPDGQRRSLKGKIHDVPPNILAPVLVEFFK